MIQFLKKRSWILLAIPLILVVLVYFQSVNNEILTNWDDQYYITKNDKIKDFSAENLQAIFTTQHMAHYQPVTLLVYAVAYNLFGHNAMAFHMLSILLHLLCVILVFLIAKRILKRPLIAGLLASVFAVLPMMSESILWISATNQLMFSLFYLLAMLLYIRHIEGGCRLMSFLLVLLVFLLALLSKSMAVSFPLVAFALGIMYRRRGGQFYFEIAFLLLFSIVAGWVAVLSSLDFGSMNSKIDYTLLERFLMVAYAFATYIVKFIFPVNISSVHYLPDAESSFPWTYYVAPFLILVVLIIILSRKKYRRELIASFFIFTFMIAPGLQFKPIGFVLVVERYTYASYFGLLLLMAFFIVDLEKSGGRFSLFAKPLGILIGIAMLISFSVKTFNRVSVWKNGITLFSDVIEKYPSKGLAYAYRADAELEKLKYLQAFTDYNIALDKSFREPSVFYNRAQAMYKLDTYKKKLETFDQKIRNNTGNGVYYYNRGTVKASDTIMDYFGAIQDYKKSIQLGFDKFFVYYNLGNCHRNMQEYDNAILCYDEVLKRKPGFADAMHNAAVSYYLSGNFVKACEIWKKLKSSSHPLATQEYIKYCN